MIFVTVSAWGFQDVGLNGVTMEDLKMDVYEPDPDAEAVILADWGESRFFRAENGFHVMFTRYTKIKIFDEAGLDWAEVEIPLYREGNIYEKVEDIQAFSYNIDEGGRIFKNELSQDQIFQEVINEQWIQKKFAIPAVKKGSVIEIKYTINTPYLFNLQDWEFQSTIPTVTSEYRVFMIPFYEYAFRLQGARKFSHYESYKDSGLERSFGNVAFKDYVHEYRMDNVPAFKDEDFITSIDDYIIKLDFQLAKVIQPSGAKTEIISSWPKMIENVEKHVDFGKYITKAERHFVKNVNYSEWMDKPLQEKISFAVNFMKSNYNYNGYDGKYAMSSIKEFTQSNTGNSANINLYLLGVLKALKIPAKPVMISTRSHGKVYKNYPFTSSFNYVLPMIILGTGFELIDGTDNLLPYDVIPTKCYNDWGLVISGEGDNWIRMNPKTTSKKVVTFEFEVDSINPSKSNVFMKEKTSVFYAWQRMKQFNNSNENFKDYLAARKYKVDFNESGFDANQKDMKSYNYWAKVQWENERIGNKIYISPFLDELISKNPLTQKERDYPVDFIFSNHNSYYTHINIPKGYKIDYLPKNKSYSNDLFDFNFVANQDGETITISFQYYFKKSVYQPDKYNRIKGYFSNIVDIANEKIVLEKIN